MSTQIPDALSIISTIDEHTPVMFLIEIEFPSEKNRAELILLFFMEYCTVKMFISRIMYI